jgi:hypothetical protein
MSSRSAGLRTLTDLRRRCAGRGCRNKETDP